MMFFTNSCCNSGNCCNRCNRCDRCNCTRNLCCYNNIPRTISVINQRPTTPTITPGPAVEDLEATADLATVITTVNSLLASLRTAGIIES